MKTFWYWTVIVFLATGLGIKSWQVADIGNEAHLLREQVEGVKTQNSSLRKMLLDCARGEISKSALATIRDD